MFFFSFELIRGRYINFGFLVSAAIFPVVQKQHQLLVTLLLCNAAAMEVTLGYVLMF